MRKIKWHFVSVGTILGLCFCAGCNPARGHLDTFNAHFEQSDFENAALFARDKAVQRKTPRGADLLWALQLGAIERLQKHYSQSNQTFDQAEEMMSFFDQQTQAFDGLGSTAVNENMIAYRGAEYDGVMVNVYKALNFMAQKEMDLARIEFNRALDRQRRAKEHFQKEIQKLQEEVAKDDKGFSKTNTEDPKVQQVVAENYPNLNNFEAYPDFVNPFASYLAGIYFNIVREPARAIDLLKESYGMVGDNSVIGQDLALTDAVLNGQGSLENQVWVIYENGLGPIKTEFRIDLPLWVATDRIQYIGIALPKLQFRSGAFPSLAIEAGEQLLATEMVVNMDRVIQTEFTKDFKVILTRAIISATAKAIAQYALSQQSSSGASLASLAMAAYSAATTAADVRIWTALPKEFQVARLTRPEDGMVRITPDGGQPFDIKIPACYNAIVYVKIISRQASPVWDVMLF